MDIKQLEISDIRPDMLDYFNRYQEVTQCWKRHGNDWVLNDVSCIRDWNKDKKESIIHCFSQCIEQGGIMIGTFDECKLIGFAVINGSLYGSQNQYANMPFLFISYEYRQKGLGSKLFLAACEKAVRLNAKKLYISAYAAKGTIDFYERMGCKDAQEIIQEVIDTPDDRQLEYILI